MLFQLSAACGCNIGRVRFNNEDNFFFDGKSLTEENAGLSGYVVKKVYLEKEILFGVFDGMGGEEFGEKASFAAAECAGKTMDRCRRFAVGPRSLLLQLCAEANRSICRKRDELLVNRMGTTAAMLLFVPDEVYVCNLGDSRIYRLRDNELSQISVDDVEQVPEGVGRKAGLTQFLGVPEDELMLEPHIVKCELKRGDVFLICSDGLTDMVSNLDICMHLRQHISAKRNVQHLIGHALRNGGRDNVTAIVIRID